MRRRLSTIAAWMFAVLFASTGLHARADGNPDATIRADYVTIRDAAMLYDPKPIAALLSDDFQRINPDGSIDGATAYLKNVTIHTAGFAVTSMDYALTAGPSNASTKVFDRTLTYVGSITFGKAAHPLRGVFTDTDTWTNTSGSWKLQHVVAHSGDWYVDGNVVKDFNTLVAPSASTLLADGWKLSGRAPALFTTTDVDTGGFNGGPMIGLTGPAARVGAFYAELIPLEAYRGKTVRVFGMLRTAAARSAGFYARADAADGKPLSMDTMHDRRLVGTHDWTPFAIVIRVPANAIGIAVGLSLNGGGSVYGSDLQIEIVPDSTPVTGT